MTASALIYGNVILTRPEQMKVAPNKLPDMASDSDGPVFSEPWQAQAFAMAVSLQEQGVFTTEQWAQELGAQLAATHKPEDMLENDHYYHCWLSALERLVEQTGLIEHTERLNRKQAWDRAARATPRGEPIVLGRESSHEGHS